MKNKSRALISLGAVSGAAMAAVIVVIALCASSAYMSSPQREKQERIETELITITTTGFEPSEITRPQGQFFLDVDNRSELNDLELHLERANGVKEKSAKIVLTAPELRLPLDLPPGTYHLRESGHSNWLSRITITAK